MTTISENHECDLFLLSSHHPYLADHSLREFANRGTRNRDGWGVGWYVNGKANDRRNAERAVEDGTLSADFLKTISDSASPTILGHLRFSSYGQRQVTNNHPFTLSFLGYDWLLVHNGTARRILVGEDEWLLEDSDSDTPRVFEYLRKEIIVYYLSHPKHSLIEACRRAYTNLLRNDPGGSYNIILSNGHLSFAFVHWRPFYLLHREKGTGDVAILSTLRLTDREDWITFPAPRGDTGQDTKAKMLVFCGPMLAYNREIRT